jgi:hypothetical protein
MHRVEFPPVSITSVVLCDKTNSEASPQTNSKIEEKLPAKAGHATPLFDCWQNLYPICPPIITTQYFPPIPL